MCCNFSLPLMKRSRVFSRLWWRVAMLLGVGAGANAASPTGGHVLDYYSVETIPLPEGEFSADAIAFMPDGRLVCSFYAGRVYLYDPATRVWSLFAAGLHTPLGVLPRSNTEVLVMQRPELTLLADRDGDGRADEFKTVSDDFGISGNYAEYNFGPVADREGNLFYGLGTGSHFGAPLTNEVRGYYSPEGAWGRMNSPVPYRGWIMKVTPDGRTIPWASGFREPNGLGVDPEGRLFCIDNQGDWVGTSKLFHVREGHFYGHVPDLVWREDFRGGKQPLDMPPAELDRLRTREAIAFPYGDMSNSPTQPVWDTTNGKFGPFAGQMFIGEMNYNRLMRVMLEEVDGELQGAVTPFFDHPALNRGNNRLAFDGKGSLWIGQTKHGDWVGQSGLQKITWRGVDPMEVSGMRLTEKGFELSFTRPLDVALAANPSSYSMRTYFYNYHENYGSEKYDLHEVKITAVRISDDRRRVALELESLEAWRIYDLKLNGVASEDGHALVSPWVVYTLNRLRRDTPPPRAPLPKERPERRAPRVPEGGVKGVGGPQDFE